MTQAIEFMAGVIIGIVLFVRPMMKATETMAAYRESAGRAPAEVDTLRQVSFDNRMYEVHPHGFGRWSCPQCGVSRIQIFESDPLSGVGVWVNPAQEKGEDVVRGSLRRVCSRCRFMWMVEGLDAEARLVKTSVTR